MWTKGLLRAEQRPDDRLLPCHLHLHQASGLLGEPLLATHRAHKKSPRKGCVPGGRRTLTFPGAIGRFRVGPAGRAKTRGQAIHLIFKARRPLPCRRWFASWSAGRSPSRSSPCRPSCVHQGSLMHDSLARSRPCGRGSDQVTRNLRGFAFQVKPGFPKGRRRKEEG